MKKLLATILALVMALGLCTSAWATEKSIGSETELKDAISSVNDGDVIKLSTDVTISEKITISKNILLDLGTHTLTSEFAPTAEDYALVAEGNVTIQNGSIVTTKDKARAVNNSKGNLNLENVIITAKGQVGVGNSATSGNVSIKNCKINSETAYAVASFAKNANVVMDINKSEMSGAYGAFYHNGTASGLTLSVTETTMSSENGDGMYLAGDAVTTLSNCTITGATGVEIRAGKLTVNGGSLKATAAYSVNPNGNGSTTEGAAIAIAQHTTKKNIEVTLNGGTYTGEKAISESNPQENDPAPQVAMSVTAGTFVGDVVTADVTNFISGGTFSNSVNPTYLADGLKYEVYAGGKYSYFASIDDAVAAAGGEGQVTNVKEEEGGTGGHTVILTDNGSVVANLYTAATSVDLPTLTKTGYTFKGWKDDAGKVHTGTFTLPSQAVTDNFYLTAVWSANSYYYYPSTSDTTTSTTTKGSPKTFDAGVGIYAVTALLSVTGMAWAGKKRH